MAAFIWILVIIPVLLFSPPVFTILIFRVLRKYSKDYPERKELLYGLLLGLIEVIVFISFTLFFEPSKKILFGMYVLLLFVQPLLGFFLKDKSNQIIQRRAIVILAAAFSILASLCIFFILASLALKLGFIPRGISA
ncbi:MAG: hypothetical protein WDN67_01005 [Candidatus Moraniibacteriota bacterium]